MGATAVEVSPFTVQSLQMKASQERQESTQEKAAFPWQTQDQTPMAVSSLSAPARHLTWMASTSCLAKSPLVWMLWIKSRRSAPAAVQLHSLSRSQLLDSSELGTTAKTQMRSCHSCGMSVVLLRKTC